MNIKRQKWKQKLKSFLRRTSNVSGVFSTESIVFMILCFIIIFMPLWYYSNEEDKMWGEKRESRKQFKKEKRERRKRK